MRIGEVASSAGVNVQTLRYYERRGLVLPTRRRGSGYREYGPEAAQRVRFIRRAQDLGFSLDEIGELLSLRDGPDPGMAEVRRVVQQRVAQIERRSRELGRMREALLELLARCERECAPRSARCVIVDALDDSITSEEPCETSV